MSAIAVGLERDELRMCGSRPGTAGKGPRLYAAGRICSETDCPTVLSRYNQSELCWQHEPRREYLSAVRGRRPTEVEVLDELAPIARAS